MISVDNETRRARRMAAHTELAKNHPYRELYAGPALVAGTVLALFGAAAYGAVLAWPWVRGHAVLGLLVFAVLLVLGFTLRSFRAPYRRYR